MHSKNKDAIHHISVCRRNLDAYLLPPYFVACPELAPKERKGHSRPPRYLHFGMNAFDAKSIISPAHNLPNRSAMDLGQLLLQAIVRIIYFILNGKIEGYIHPTQLAKLQIE